MTPTDTQTSEVTTWPHLAEGLYRFLSGRGATIEYAFEDMEVMVPRDTGADAPSAKWRVNGTLRVWTSEPGRGARPGITA